MGVVANFNSDVHRKEHIVNIDSLYFTVVRAPSVGAKGSLARTGDPGAASKGRTRHFKKSKEPAGHSSRMKLGGTAFGGIIVPGNIFCSQNCSRFLSDLFIDGFPILQIEFLPSKIGELIALEGKGERISIGNVISAIPSAVHGEREGVCPSLHPLAHFFFVI